MCPTDGTCIPGHWLCDGTVDCVRDAADEENCSEYQNIICKESCFEGKKNSNDSVHFNSHENLIFGHSEFRLHSFLNDEILLQCSGSNITTFII